LLDLQVDGEPILDLAFTLAGGLIIVIASRWWRGRRRVAGRSGAFLRGEAQKGLAAGQAEDDARGPVFVLAGQGPQRPGMGLELAAREPVFRAAWRSATGWWRVRPGGPFSPSWRRRGEDSAAGD